jgi:hypothetical protein
MACGVPEWIAPYLIGLTEGEYWHCYWKKQPETQEELALAIRILHTQELDCHRYAGSDRTILEKLPQQCCDHHTPIFESTELDFSKGRMPQFPLLEEEGGLLSKLWRKIIGRWH